MIGSNDEGNGTLKKIVPLFLALLLVSGILYLAQSCGEDPARGTAHPVQEAMAKITLPGGVEVSVPEGAFSFKLAQFLADGNDKTLPRTFVFDHLNFESASTKITPESEQTLKDLTAILKAYPAVNVRLEGHTDSAGAKEANKMLSQNRADAIRVTLVASGVDTKRMETAGWGEEKPIASNDTEEGRAQNRRLEMTVLSK
jgi:outer membrane protein OmpA-like peptidoglycan-associated protein